MLRSRLQSPRRGPPLSIIANEHHYGIDSPIVCLKVRKGIEILEVGGCESWQGRMKDVALKMYSIERI